ncbi:cupin domain-containing protein [Congregibacter litoralis]|uniref:Anti-ECFsigma factor, ChrR n=1 Tax=Congregibacter litoralis KT71 TaxID=314285 RepID=A4AC30_9GAMM|nr:cupin domain-containing protein [Congregibacter litoralis]EAQ96480.1 anti-ECFsigma factor, ChrR [Congregibacter litoralis KT71]
MTASILNGDLSRRTAVDSSTLDWQESPGGEVLRKRLHRVGPAESGQVTSLVRYQPGSRFPAHAHPDGEEILVLDGVFSDEHGDWPAGTYLLNPEGFRHAPFSKDGCLLFVKLRQFPGESRKHVALDTNTAEWRSSVRPGVAWKKLYAQDSFSDHMRLERWAAPGNIGTLNFPQGAELFVLRGSFADAQGDYPTHSWLRLPPGSSLTPEGNTPCELYIKEGGFPYLREA